MQTSQVKVAAILSLPRLGFNDAWGCVQDALSPLNIPVSRFNGVFWGQCMQRAFTEMVQGGVDWILTIDYDSMFTHRHVDHMLSTFHDNPHIDALAPLQVKRASTAPLLYKKDQTKITFDKEKPFRVDSAHFGLTLLRASKIASLPKPWFASRPGPSGEWDDDRTDEDIWFWNEWYDAGNNCYIEPRVKIGHLELMVSEFTEDFGVVHSNVSKWRDREYGRGREGVCLRAVPLPQGPEVEQPVAGDGCSMAS